HVLCAWDPDDGSSRWVNMAWPGYVAVVTGINAKGTLVSLHDYNSSFVTEEGAVCRCVATRYVLTGMNDQPVEDDLSWAEGELSNMTIATGTFINYYAPEGHGGVFTCSPGGSCGSARTPQSEYMNAEVLITTNSQTDGTGVPSGGEFMDDYYQVGAPKDLAGHFDLMETDGLHLVSLEYRGEEDMTIWAHGRGRADRIEIEWSDLFPNVYPDGGQPDGGTVESQSGCGCSSSGRPAAGLAGFLGVILLYRRRLD
ncbi:MAG: hypothetical protein JRJ19_03610, partial [Deltaproteobacteria bacterium]|nr:hypothetical protein [Deltaproteobacteria bacterium]